MYHRYERSVLGCHFFPVLVIVQLIGPNPYFSKRCISLSIENRSNSIIKPNSWLRLNFFDSKKINRRLHRLHYLFPNKHITSISTDMSERYSSSMSLISKVSFQIGEVVEWITFVLNCNEF